MIISEINYINYRNLKDYKVEFSSKINLFYGKNGQGKTSLLEAIYFVGTGKSFRTKKINDCIKYGKYKGGVFTIYEDNISRKDAIVKLIEGRKEFYLNGKKVPYDEYYGKINIISYIPEDILLINSVPSIRRDFFDGEISQANHDYFLLLKNFNNLLKIRNKYIKEKKHKSEEFSIYQNEFIKHSALIIKNRLEYVKLLSSLLSLNYRKLFDNTTELILEYSCHLGSLKKKTLSEIEKMIEEQIKEKFVQELKYGFSLVGPQKDDFLFLLNSYESKANASQGEKKSIIFSLKLAEIDMVLRDKKENPILILDDVTSYFDSSRLYNVLNYLEKRNIQIFISSTEKLNIKSKNFYIKEGEVSDDDHDSKDNNHGDDKKES
ncbi:DNA replication/repair protein RecF [Fusobacterium sp. PH5-44]|uniref:DNA replication/repair protein RecF n=1 Tax=unclassified Fusobacterium TaxID=2648384 RepID=UPI003D198F07